MYQVFTEEYPEVRISRSKFASLRPGHILLDAQMLKRVCFCWYHKNFIMLLETLPKVHPNIPTYSHEFPKGLVCVLPTEVCWNNKCSSSKDSKSKYHYYIKQKQSKVLLEHEKESEEWESNVSVLENDFPDKIQSAHWKKTQITVFTAAPWQNGKC